MQMLWLLTSIFDHFPDREVVQKWSKKDDLPRVKPIEIWLKPCLNRVVIWPKKAVLSGQNFEKRGAKNAQKVIGIDAGFWLFAITFCSKNFILPACFEGEFDARFQSKIRHFQFKKPVGFISRDMPFELKNRPSDDGRRDKNRVDFE